MYLSYSIYIYMCVCVCIYIYIYSWFGLQGKTCTMKQKYNNIQKKNQVPGVSECLQQVNADMFVSWLITGNRTHPERTYSFPRCFATFEVLLRQLHTIALFIVIVSYRSTFRTIKGKVGRSLMVELWSIISRSDLKVNHPKQSWHHP